MNNPENCPPKSNNVASADDLAEVLEELHITADDLKVSAQLARELTTFDHFELRRFDRSPAVKAAEAAQEERHRKIAARSAKQARDDYAAVKHAAGDGEVNAYKWHEHEPRQRHESEELFSLRKKRDRQRSYRGTSNEEVEARKLARQVMTPEDKKEEKAKRERDRRAAMTQEQKDADAARKREKRRDAAELAAVAAEAQRAAKQIV